VSEAAGTDPRVRLLASRQTYAIGAYLGVPIMLTDRSSMARCVLDPAPHHFTAQDLDLLAIVSGWLRLYLEHNPLHSDA
jgi:GAF domain-containing protein